MIWHLLLFCCRRASSAALGRAGGESRSVMSSRAAIIIIAVIGEWDTRLSKHFQKKISYQPNLGQWTPPYLSSWSQHNTVSVSRQFVVCGHLLLHDALHGGPAGDHVHGVRQPAAGLRRAAAQEEEGQLHPHPRHQVAGDWGVRKQRKDCCKKIILKC